MAIAKKIILAMSHGLKSYGLLSLLQKQGHQIIPIHFHNSRLEELSDANSHFCYFSNTQIRERLEEKIAKLKLSLITLDLKKQFEEVLFSQWRLKTQLGSYYDPFFDYTQILLQSLLEAKKQMGADLISTGHYCRLRPTANHKIAISKSVEVNKDQSYLFCQLNQSELGQFFLPAGELKASDIKKIARQYFELNEEDFPAIKNNVKRSIFLGTLKTSTSIENLLTPGAIIIRKNKQKIGRHHGLHRYTEGELLDPQLLDELKENHTEYRIISKNYLNNQLNVMLENDYQANQSPYSSLTCQKTSWNSADLKTAIHAYMHGTLIKNPIAVEIIPKISPYLCIRSHQALPIMPKGALVYFTKSLASSDSLIGSASLTGYEFQQASQSSYDDKIWI